MESVIIVHSARDMSFGFSPGRRHSCPQCLQRQLADCLTCNAIFSQLSPYRFLSWIGMVVVVRTVRSAKPSLQPNSRLNLTKNTIWRAIATTHNTVHKSYSSSYKTISANSVNPISQRNPIKVTQSIVVIGCILNKVFTKIVQVVEHAIYL